MKLKAFDTDKVLQALERKSIYTVDSDFKAVGYAINDGCIYVFAGKDGWLSLKYEQIEGFCEELKEVLQLAKDRQCMQIKGA